MRRATRSSPPVLAAAAAAVACGLLVLGPQEVAADQGTMRLRCGQSLYVAAWVPQAVVHPGGLADIHIPVGVMPYALFGTQSSCGDPTSTKIELTGTCTPADGGAEVLIGPASVPTVLPVLPGRQSTLTGPGGAKETGGVFDFMVPAGTLRADTDWKVRVDVRYDVVFGAGIGAGTVSASTSALAGIVAPSPKDGAVPLLHARTVPADAGIQEVRKGDQRTFFFLVENNDPTRPMVLDLVAHGTQIARMPESTAADAPLFSVGMPVTGGLPAIAFTDEVAPGALLPVPDLPGASEVTAEKQMILGAGGIGMVGIDVRGAGDESAGAAYGVSLDVHGTVGDTRTSAFVSAVSFVSDEAEGRSPLRELRIGVNAGPFWRVHFTTPTFTAPDGKRTVAALFGPGNDPNPEVEGYDTTKAGILYSSDLVKFGAEGADSVRTDAVPATLDLDAVWQKFPNSLLHQNQIRMDLRGLRWPFQVRFPVLAKAGAVFTQMLVDAAPAADEVVFSGIQLTNHGVRYSRFHEGSFQAAVAGDDPAVTPDASSYFDVEGDDVPPRWRSLRLRARELAREFDLDDADAEFAAEFVFPDDGEDWDDGDFDAGVEEDGLTAALSRLSALRGSLIVRNAAPQSVPTVPHTLVSRVSIADRGDTIVIGAPIALRRKSADAAPSSPFGSVKALVKSFFPDRGGRLRDKAQLILQVNPTIAPGSDTKRKAAPLPESCRGGVVDLGGLTFRYTLDAKGRFRSADRRVSVLGKLSTKTGLLQLKCKLAKSDLHGPLADDGLTDADTPPSGVSLAIPLRAFTCGTVYDGAASVRWKAKRGKSGTAKSEQAQ